MRKHRIKELRNELFTAINKLNFKGVKRCVGKAKIKGVQNEIINGKQYGMAPIHFATYRASPKILQFLLSNGADINAVSDACLVPSTFIVVTHDMSKMEKVVLLCVQNETSLGGIRGFTALHLALYHCRLDIAKVLLDNNIDVNIRSTNGKIAFEVIPGYESLCSDGCDTKKILLALLRLHKNNCRALLLSAKAKLEAGDTTDAASSTANPFSASTRANIKIGLEANNTKDLVSSTVNSSFTLTRENFKEASSITNSAVKPFSFINSMFSWVRASTTATLSGLFSSVPALPPAQQSVDHLAGSPIGSSQVDFNGTALLTDVMVRKLTGKKYSRPLDNSFLTIEQIKERKLNSLERDVRMALSKCEKLYQCPGSLLGSSTIFKGMHQKSL